MGMVVFLVMRGLDPRIHLKEVAIQDDGLPEQSTQDALRAFARQ
jgi:hypothetical protein